MPLQDLLASLGDEIEDAEEEAFLLFSMDIPSQNLGFVDAKATTLEVTVGNQDFTIHQSPSLLTSERDGGTTGAVLWKITPAFAAWLASPHNPLTTHSLLTPSTTILELGTGISGLLALTLSPLISRYILTDQPYITRLLFQNLAANTASSLPPRSKQSKAPSKKNVNANPKNDASKTSSSDISNSNSFANGKIWFEPLDWETQTPSGELTHDSNAKSFDVVLACDCIYNSHLIVPFVSTLRAAAALRCADSSSSDGNGEGSKDQALVIIAQQLRSADVFEEWLEEFSKFFRCWRVSDEVLGKEGEGLRPDRGFVVHVGVLR